MTHSFHDKLTKAYPAVDAEVEYAKIDVWAEGNPEKRKTPRGMKRFLQRWFEKAQNDAARFQVRSPAQAVPFAVREEKERSQRNLDARAKSAFGGGR